MKHKEFEVHGREVQIVWIESFVDGIQGRSNLFANWEEHLAWLKMRRAEIFAFKKVAAKSANSKTPFSSLEQSEAICGNEKPLADSIPLAA